MSDEPRGKPRERRLSAIERAIGTAIVGFGQREGQRELAARFGDLLATDARVFERDFFEDGHFTGSSWLVSADGTRVLLTEHRKLGRWLQLGGHADGDPDLAAVALREAREESGLRGLVVEGPIFDIDRHRIPARAGEPSHYHYDVRYVVRATAGERYRISEESTDLRWWPIAEVLANDRLDASLRRMADRWMRAREGGR